MVLLISAALTIMLTPQATVASGELATFSYRVRAPADANGIYTFNGDLVVSSTGKVLHPEGYYHRVTVSAPPASGAMVRASFEGSPSRGANQGYHPDHALAVGPSSVLMVSNNVVVIRDKAGGQIASMSTRDFYRPALPPGVDVGGDPWMTHDASSGRFFYVTDGSAGNGHDTQCKPGECRAYHLLAVSKSAVPRSLGASDWHYYALDRTLLRLPGGVRETANWGDWDNIVVDRNTLLISWPAYAFGVPSGGAGQSQGMKVRLIDKTRLIQGEPVDDWTDLELKDPITGAAVFQKAEPATGSGGSAPFFLVATRGCEVLVWAIDSPQAAPSVTGKTLLPDRSCDGAGGLRAVQPDGVSPVDVVTTNHNAVYRAGSIWYSHLVVRGAASRPVSAIRWFEIDVSNWPGAPRFVQDGILEQNGVFHLSPAITVTKAGNAVIVFGRTSATEYLSLYYTFRLATDARGTLRPASLMKAGQGTWAAFSPHTGDRNRWVDFFAATVDSVDDSAWVFGAYVTPDGKRGTWIANVVVSQ